MKIKFSILINNYNYGVFLDDCLKSIVNQSFTNYEIILYDDCSSDNSLTIARKYLSDDQIIIGSEKSESNCWNQARAIESGYLKCSGDYICLLDADDIFHKNKLSILRDIITDEGDYSLIQNYSISFETASKRILNYNNFFLNNPHYQITKKNNLLFLSTQTSSLTFSRKFLDANLPLPRDNLNLVWSDVRLSRIAAYSDDIYTVRQPLTFYRSHGNNDSNKLQDRNFYKTAILQQYIYFNNYLQSINCKQIQIPKYFISENSILSKLVWIIQHFGFNTIFKILINRLYNKCLIN